MLTHDYLTIPRKLLIELRDTPLAIGIYVLTARLALVQQAPVPLSRGDLQQIDPALRVGAITRALDRLVTSGWLLPHDGPKRRYLPSWGRTRQGQPYPWQPGARLGCPTYIAVEAVRVDRRLLDLFVGRFTPHDRNAYIERYVELPLLGLADVGRYVRGLVLPSAPQAGDPLGHWGLLDNAGQPQPIPDDTLVLTLASQQAALGSPQLTAAGWRKLGLGAPAPTPATGSAAPLFFVPKERVGELIAPPIGQVIGSATPAPAAHAAPERPKHPRRTHRPAMQGTHQDSQDSASPPPPPRGGGGIAPATQPVPLPATPAAQRLAAINAHPESIADLAAMPETLVAQAIAYAASEPNIRSQAGWVVDALRRHRACGWPLPTPRQSAAGWQPHDLAGYLDAAHNNLFRLGSDLADLTDVPAPVAAAPEPPVPRPCAPAQPPDPPAPVPEGTTAAALTALVQAQLLQRCDRFYHRAIQGLHVQVVEQTTVVACAQRADRLRIAEGLLGMLRATVVALGAPAQIRLVDEA